MKKVTLLTLVALLVVSFGSLAIAAPVQGPAPGNWYCPYYGQYYSDLTDEQKAQITTWQQQMLEQRKQMLAKQVEWGYITQAQADRQIAWMEQRIANGNYGWGMHGMGMMGMRGGMGCW